MSDTDKIRHLFARMHTVIPNDTLATISKSYYGEEKFADDLARVNGIAVNAILTVGKRIKVPPLAKLSAPVVTRDNLAGIGDTMTEVTVTGTKPFYLNPMFYAGAVAGFGLAYLLLEFVFKKQKR